MVNNVGFDVPGLPPSYHFVPSLQPEYEWIVIVGGIFCFLTACGIGANDTSNSWGSTVGSKCISVRNAAILAGIFEVTGAFALGANVGGTLKNKIIAPSYYCDDNYSLVVKMLGMMTVDLSSATWLFICSMFGVPVSTTHAAVGGVAGFGIVTRGWGAITWWETMGKIFISWGTSPILSALIAFICQTLVKRFLLQAPTGKVFKRTLLVLPTIASCIIALAVTFAFFIGGKSNSNIKTIEGWVFGVTFVGTFFVSMAILNLLSVFLRKKYSIDLDKFKPEYDAQGNPVIEYYQGEKNFSDFEYGYDNSGYPIPPPEGFYPGGPFNTPVAGFDYPGGPPPAPGPYIAPSSAPYMSYPYPVPYVAPGMNPNAFPGPVPSAATAFNNQELQQKDIYEGQTMERVETERYWMPLCLLVACVESFSHGANDVGNAIGPYSALIDAYNANCPKGTKDIPYWILGLGAAGILIGLVLYGHRVMRTLGVRIAVITPQKAAVAETAAVITILIATALAIPVSTTHCSVGGITGMSLADGWRHINWRTVGRVVIAILLTVPACALLNGALFGFFQAATFGSSYPGSNAFNQFANVTNPGPWPYV